MSLPSSNKELFLILQFLYENKWFATAHELEKESGVYFNMKYFEECIKNGEWDKLEYYLSGFMKVEDDLNSIKTYIDIRKFKYLEALDKRDYTEAANILRKELKMFAKYDREGFEKTALLVTTDDIRKHNLSEHGDSIYEKTELFESLKYLIEKNAAVRDKLQFPKLERSSLKALTQKWIMKPPLPPSYPLPLPPRPPA